MAVMASGESRRLAWCVRSQALILAQWYYGLRLFRVSRAPEIGIRREWLISRKDGVVGRKAVVCLVVVGTVWLGVRLRDEVMRACLTVVTCDPDLRKFVVPAAVGGMLWRPVLPHQAARVDQRPRCAASGGEYIVGASLRGRPCTDQRTDTTNGRHGGTPYN